MTRDEQIDIIVHRLAEAKHCYRCGVRLRFGDLDCPRCGADIEDTLREWAEKLLDHLNQTGP